MTNLHLLPAPRSLTSSEGVFVPANGQRIVLQSSDPGELLFSAQRLQTALRTHAKVDWELTATAIGPTNEIGAVLLVGAGSENHPQGYRLTISPEGITVDAHSAAGIFYAICTLIQIIEQSSAHLPCVQIVDWPDFAARGVMLDVSRDKVPTLETLLELVDLLASWKINQLQLYTEHTFAYRNHREVWADASPMTGQDILVLDAYCKERFVELVPNQNSFGHMHRWLTHERYKSLAEVTEGFNTPWGYTPGPFSLTPSNPDSLQLVTELFDELLPHFSSRQFNVGCDETFDLGQGQSKEECEQRGTGRVYLDFLLKIYEAVRERGHTMQFWGDIIMEQPELVSELPRDTVALEWGYEAGHPFNTHCPQFAAAGIPFYVCPGTSSWCSIAGRTDNAINNLLNAAENGLKHGAVGFLITDWGDRGHWQALPVSYLGFAVGAAYAWALEANREMDVAHEVSLHAFRDATGVMGHVAYDLGNVYRAVGVEPHNASVLFWTLQQHPNGTRTFPGVTAESFTNALAAVDAAIDPLPEARIDRPDAALIIREMEQTARLLRHACRRGLLQLNGEQDDALHRELDQDMAEIITEYQQVWLERNRLGGLSDSVARLEEARQEYRA